MKARHVITNIFLRLIILLATLGVIIYGLIGTEAGMQFIWATIERSLPETLHVGRVQGTLLTNFGIYDVSYQNNNATITLKKLELQWETWPLLHLGLVLKTLSVDGLHVTIKPVSSSSGQMTSIDVNQWLRVFSKLNVRQANVHDIKIDMGDSTITLDGSLNTNWHVQWSASIAHLSTLLPHVQGSLLSQGLVSGARLQPTLAATVSLANFVSEYVNVKSAEGKFYSQFNSQQQDRGVLQIKGLSIKGFLVPDSNLQTNSGWRHEDYQLQATIAFSPVNHIVADFNLPAWRFTYGLMQVFRGKASAEVNDFSQFNLLFKQFKSVRNFAGKVTGSFTGSGTIGQPVFDGGLKTENGSVFIPSAGIALQKIHLTARYHTGNKVMLNGTCHLLDGAATVTGTYDIENSALPLQLAMRANDIVLKKAKEYKITINPSINLAYQHDDLSLSGDVIVPNARIHPTDFGATATLPSDVVIINQPEVTPATPTNVTMQLQLSLGDDVVVRYHGLHAALRGAINIRGVPGTPLTATGQFLIANNSNYKAYGKTLGIIDGRLIYAGNLLTNPGISLRAATTVKTVGFTNTSQFQTNDFKPVYAGTGDMTVGIDVSGMLDKPVIRLYSDPAGLSQGDILSYLLFGYPQAQASGASSLALLSAASEMVGGQNKKNLVTNLQQSLGLDELSVGSTEYYNNKTDLAENTTTVNIGRSLGHRLSLHYSVGLFQPVQIFSLRYQINKHLVLQTETSTLENGGDLLYQLESRE